MSTQRVCCKSCQRRIADVRRGLFGRTVRPTADGLIVFSDQRQVRVRCRHCQRSELIML